MDRLLRLKGSSGQQPARKRYSGTPVDDRAAKRPRGLASTPAPASTDRAATLSGSEPAEAAREDYGRSNDTEWAENALESARQDLRQRQGLFHIQENDDLQAWHDGRVKAAAQLSEHMHKPYTPDYYHHRHPNERVFRVWIPADPDESPLLGPRTHVRTVHNKSRAHIVRLVEDQLEATEQVYAIRQKYLGSLTASLATGSNPFESAKKDQTVLSLRLQGVEVTEYQARPERFEVYFEDPSVKMAARQ